jgi:hypothetical protein
MVNGYGKTNWTVASASDDERRFPQRTKHINLQTHSTPHHYLTLIFVADVHFPLSYIPSTTSAACNGPSSSSPGLSHEYPCYEKPLELHCWLSHTSKHDIDARQRHFISSQQRSNQCGSWTAIMVCTTINLIFLDPCRVPSYAPSCSTITISHDSKPPA